MNAKITFSLLFACCAVACGDASDNAGLDRRPGQTTDEPGAPGTPPGEDPDTAKCAAKSYLGFDDVELTADRRSLAIGVDRARLKPFSALKDEYARVLGATPASVQGSGATFGQVPARWYEEPETNAIALQTAYGIAFDGCLTYTASAAEFAAAPTPATAPAACAAMARRFWSKTPSPQEIDACVDVATVGAAKETNARRKWAYACASVLTSAGFLTY